MTPDSDDYPRRDCPVDPRTFTRDPCGNAIALIENSTGDGLLVGG